MRAAAGDEFRDLLTLVRQSGLLAKQPAYYLGKIIINLALFVGAFLLIKCSGTRGSNSATPLSSPSSSRNSASSSTTPATRKFSASPRRNEALGLLHSNLLLGFSYSWWLHKHNTIIARRTTSPPILTWIFFPSHFPKARPPQNTASRASP